MLFTVMSFTPSTIQAKANYGIESIEQKYNLQKVDYELPENAKVLKFDTVEQAEDFLIILKENEETGILNLESLVSSDELNEDIINLSNVDISENNFIKDENIIIDAESIYMGSRAINTIEHASTNVGGTAFLNVDASATYDWKSGVGNHYTTCSSVSSYMSGFYLGSAWTQTSYAYNITNRGKTLNVTVRGKYDYFILINTSLTHLGGQAKSYNASWTLR